MHARESDSPWYTVPKPPWPITEWTCSWLSCSSAWSSPCMRTTAFATCDRAMCTSAALEPTTSTAVSDSC